MIFLDIVKCEMWNYFFVFFKLFVNLQNIDTIDIPLTNDPQILCKMMNHEFYNICYKILYKLNSSLFDIILLILKLLLYVIRI